jgi:hypothetical protein
MADGGDSDRPRDCAGEVIDPALLDGINAAIVELGGSPDPIRRAIAARLREDRGLVAYIAGVANRQGHSFGDELRTEQRNRLFHQLGATMTASKLREELSRYQSATWSRDREKPNPYPEYDPRFLLYKILTLKDHVPSDGHMRAILRTKRV